MRPSIVDARHANQMSLSLAATSAAGAQAEVMLNVVMCPVVGLTLPM
jgi:hypothetical protein